MKNKIIEFRDNNKEYRKLCSVILGEFDRLSKTPTNEQCIQVIKKMIESNKLTGNIEENTILEQFLPQQLKEGSIMILLLSKKFSNLGECMKFFKENYNGQYDGKLVSDCYKKCQGK